jgi:peroxiredoxin
MDSSDNVFINRFIGMKKMLLLVFVIILTGLTAILITGIVTKTHKRKIVKERIRTLPSFSLKTLSDTLFSSDQIKEGPALVLFFHPECEHCKYEITTLFKNWVKTSGIHVLLISNAERDEIKNFLREKELLDRPGIISLVDETCSLRNYFRAELVPAAFIYDKKLKLVRCFQGEARPEIILKYLRQDD